MSAGSVVSAVAEALAVSATMAWRIGWSLVLGFALSAVVQALVDKQTVSRLLGDDRPATLVRATGFGVAASSCSYAAVALARSLFRKGASFTAAMTFQIASTNLVIELGIVLALLLGWRFTLAEFVGGPLIIVMVATAFRVLVGRKVVEAAREQADRGVAGSMEGHAGMDMSVDGDGGLLKRLVSPRGFTSVSRVFVMEWAAVLRDIVLGLLVAGAVAAWVPDSWWQRLFLTDHGTWTLVWGPVVGPVIALLSFVCSIGNVPLAAVLWSGGISFGGVVAFLYADLLIVPILLIYRKYYGMAMTVRIVLVFYVALVVAGYVVEMLFLLLGLLPHRGGVSVEKTGVSWNYTTWLDIAFGLLAVVLVVRFLRTGGRAMLSMMNGDPADIR
ncbi:permease [Nocardioides islandensis]|uniref:permease n=1 Tax=Nocardioides islandensis TaxID=433663 RepID=UPI002B269CCF|nr:permease [Nocardioides islandensis]